MMRQEIDYDDLALQRERLKRYLVLEDQGPQLFLGAGVVFILALILFSPACCYRDGIAGIGKGLGISTIFSGGFAFLAAAVRFWGGR